MEIKKVALIGAGAIGSYLIWGLSRLADLSFTVIAAGKRGDRAHVQGTGGRTREAFAQKEFPFSPDLVAARA